MAEDLLPVLTRFHREVLVPDVKRIVGEAVDALEQRINTRFDEVNGHFDGIYQRFDRLETEYHRGGPGAPRHPQRAALTRFCPDSPSAARTRPRNSAR